MSKTDEEETKLLSPRARAISLDRSSSLFGWRWDRVRNQLVKMGRTVRGVTQGLRELKRILRIAGRYALGEYGRRSFLVGFCGWARL
jgi:hypothetical protein